MRYFFIVFGEEHANQHPVEGGLYPHHKGHIGGSLIRPGHVALLYCGESYLAHSKEAPGIGVVLQVNTGGTQENICYQYFPLDHPIDWDTVLATINPRQPLGFIGNWLQETDGNSFRNALVGRQIDWP